MSMNQTELCVPTLLGVTFTLSLHKHGVFQVSKLGNWEISIALSLV